jgi:trimethylamine:corrinoid methyltransferase-like protein
MVRPQGPQLLNILSTVGIRVESHQAGAIFQKAIGSKTIEGDNVKIPSEIVEAALKTASPSLDIYNRKGKKCIRFPGEARFGLGVTTLYYQDPQTDQLCPFSRKHVETCARLGNRLAFYDPMSYLLNLACGEMMTFYQIPHYGNSGNAVGWGGDIIAAGHQWMNHVLACMGNAGMAVFVGTVLGSKTFSPKLAVYADEVIAQARRISKGFEVDDYSILMREIVAAGPAGNFLSSDLTLKHFRQAYFQSAIFPSFTMEDWSSDGCPKAENYLSRYTNDMIEDLSISDESFAMIEKGEAFIARRE